MSHRIQNFDALATSALRKDALAIVEVGYAAINTGEAIRRKLRIEDGQLHIGDITYALAGRRVFFVGVGKCAQEAAEAVETLFGDYLTSGITLDVSSREHRILKKIETYVGTHPLPSEVNVQATKRIIEFLSGCEEKDLVIMLISGGGSTLLCSPTAPMTCLDEGTLWSELTARGARIQDINTVRKHTSQARGGALAEAAYPAEVLSLIVSDVPGNDIEYIASGPTVRDTSTVADAEAILAKYNIPLTNPVRNQISNGASIEFKETPKEVRYFEHVTNILFVTNEDALKAMQNEAKLRGYATEIVNTQFMGEARDIGDSVVDKLHNTRVATALFYAGESTVTLTTPAKNGGRNQEIALAALANLRDDELILPFASDGHDNTDHAGAIADSETRAHAQAQHLSLTEYLDAHRSYDFFSVTNDALVTGYTGSNVSDLIIALKK